jgi:hypothetical protein
MKSFLEYINESEFPGIRGLFIIDDGYQMLGKFVNSVPEIKDALNVMTQSPSVFFSFGYDRSRRNFNIYYCDKSGGRCYKAATTKAPIKDLNDIYGTDGSAYSVTAGLSKWNITADKVNKILAYCANKRIYLY